MLEHHADLAANFVDPLEVVGQLDAIDNQAALLPALDAVDAAQERRLAAAGRPADHDALAAHDLQAHVAQHVEGAEPLVEADDLDRDRVAGRGDVRGTAARIVRWLDVLSH